MSGPRLAVVGIDGTGKTTVLRHVRRTAALAGAGAADGAGGLAVIHTTRAHEDPDSPAAALSMALADASAAADALGRIHLKVAVLCLQLSLYGPAERSATERGRTVLADRHPLIDSLVYLPMFAGLAPPLDPDPEADVAAWWAMQEPYAARAVHEWLLTCTGNGAAGAGDPWSLGAELLRLGTLPPARMLDRLSERFGVAPPDGVLLFDLPVEQAVRRTRQRTRGSELHETTALLSTAQRRYHTVLDWLARTRPGTAVHHIDCAGRSVAEVAELVRRTCAALSRPDRLRGRPGNVPAGAAPDSAHTWTATPPDAAGRRG
ncbi:hypothetical protein [Streptomyces tailanensis]|uniref:hypothetical protein n=1 Tax=Streptomyces tailanensis TaxID=2569858 RepID=UPI00122E06DE|nr:hypothetical protein [Streptomyces tailanensis]